MERAQGDETLERTIAELTARVRAYQAARQPASPAELRAENAAELKRVGIVKLGIKRHDGTVQTLGAETTTSA